MRLILIRHGQTESNVGRLLDTALPGPGLTDLGQRQAQALVEAFRDVPIDALAASSALRTQQTAAPLAAARGLDLRLFPGAREIAAGELEMQGGQANISAYLGTVYSWLQGHRDRRMPGADSGHEVLDRFDAAVEQLCASGDLEPSATVVLVSHGAMIRYWAASRVEGMDPEHPERYELSNTGVVVLESIPGEPGTDADHKSWRLVRWISGPAGGPELADRAHDGPADDAFSHA
ncbi:histidine phosphatase family protein [Psychromicrobium xiongbiense]|uniref:histidine phosphatase family protein n=1 Tax=Psychromicrobium xiongbiense TaxID=3051184 RepID=UPI0025529EE8|nr:histidine phosphatase family protein [Psychromicrobium sp. YIM S02556]